MPLNNVTGGERRTACGRDDQPDKLLGPSCFTWLRWPDLVRISLRCCAVPKRTRLDLLVSQPSCSCSAGGVALYARGGKIVCNNSLDARFDQAFQELLPVTRTIIFGQRAAVKVPKAAAPAHH